jgi:hypothetical protein
MKSSEKWIIKKKQMWNNRKIVKMDSKFIERKNVARCRQVLHRIRIMGSTAFIECSYATKRRDQF